jgi:hypothetical protein
VSHIWVEIERLVLDGLPLDPAKGQRLTALSQKALERLLRERGISAPARLAGPKAIPTEHLKLTAGMTESRMADELAEALYRALDRKA